MNSGTSTPADGSGMPAEELEFTRVLGQARAAQAARNTAYVHLLRAVATWGALHVVDDLADAATWRFHTSMPGRVCETGIPLAGEGAPLVSEYAPDELGAALGMSTDSARILLADALELAHRLPKLWARVIAGEVPAHKARAVAQATQVLTLEAAGFVDTQLAPYLHKVGLRTAEKLINQAIERFMPGYAAEQREDAKDRLHFDVDFGSDVGSRAFSGTARVDAEMDLADALDLDAAVAAGAEQQRRLGSTEPLDVRRARAAGDLARRQLAFGFDTEATDNDKSGGFEAPLRSAPQPPSRDLTLYLHLSADVLGDRVATGSTTGQTGWVENRGGHLITADAVRDWIGAAAAGDTRIQVTVRPVIDLNANLTSPGYRPSPTLREQVVLRDRTCRFPGCNRPVRGSADLDHLVPYDTGGSTSSVNLAGLCRHHHRSKTHNGWRYRMLRPGLFEWWSPHGEHYLVDPIGTTDLTPQPPPGPVSRQGP